MDNRPICFLDSGVGGLTVVRELMRQLPHEEIVYIGDSARAPYGPRPAEQIREYTWELVNFLLTKNVKMIVFACNTATAVAWKEVKEKLAKLRKKNEKINERNLSQINDEKCIKVCYLAYQPL